MIVASIVLTAALVAITAFYAWQTKRTVDELRHARGANVFPMLTISFEHPGGPVAFPVVTNCGTGPALDIDVEMSYEPAGPTIAWTTSVMVVGERERFRGPDDTANFPKLIEKYERVVLKGACRDALGDTHQILQVVHLKRYWESNVEAGRMLDRDYQQMAAEELEKIRREIEQIRREAERAGRAAERQPTPE